MTESAFTSLSDQATLIYNSADLSAPVLPVTNGNSLVIKEFLIQEPKSDVRVVFRGVDYGVKRIFDEGVGLMFEMFELGVGPQVQTQNVSMTILMQEEVEFEIRTVNGFKLHLEVLGAEIIV